VDDGGEILLLLELAALRASVFATLRSSSADVISIAWLGTTRVEAVEPARARVVPGTVFDHGWS